MKEKRIGFMIAEGIIKALVVAAICYMIYHYARIAYAYGYQIYNQTAMEEGEGTPVHVTVPEGSDVSDVARILKRAGLIGDTRLFSLQERLGAYHGKLYPGEYDFTTAMTPDDMMALMAQNAPAVEEETQMEPEDDAEEEELFYPEETTENDGIFEDAS